MKKIKISLTISALIYLIVTKNVNAAACTDVPSKGDYTVSQTDCYISSTGITDGIDECLDSPTSLINTALLTISSNGSLTLPPGTSENKTILAVGSIAIGDGGSISLGENSSVSIGAPLYITDADGDGYPAASLIKNLTKSTGKERVCAMNITDSVKNILAAVDYDSDDNDPNVHNCVAGNYYVDADGDTYGTGSLLSTCLPAGTPNRATNNTDCDDTNASKYQNISAYTDTDGDLYSTGTASNICSGASLAAGYVSAVNRIAADCDDAQSTVFASHAACYWDLDKDTYSDGNTSGKTCLNNASCNSATKGSLGGGVAPTTYTAGQLLNSANGADCHENGTGANLVWATGTCYLDSDNDDYGDQGASAKTCLNNATCLSATAGSTGDNTTVSSSTNFSATNDDCGPNLNNGENAHPNQTTYYDTTFTNTENASLVYDWNCNGVENKDTTHNLAYNCTPTAVTEKGCDNVRDKCTGGAYAIGTWNNYSAATFACGETGCYSTGTYTHSCNCTWLTNRSTCGFSTCTEITAASEKQKCI